MMLNAFAFKSRLVKSFTKSHSIHSNGKVVVSKILLPTASCVRKIVALPPVEILEILILVTLPVSVKV